MARLWQLYHADVPDEAGATVRLERDEAHHLRRVLRLAPGEAVSLFDGRGAHWRATVLDGDAVRLDAPLEERVDAPIRIELYQGLCRPEKMDWLVQKTTEIGVAAIYPLPMARSGKHGCTDRRLARWRKLAIEACKQCGRSLLPEITPVAALPPADPGASAFLLDARDGTPSIGSIPPAQPERFRLAVGPAGGMTDAELDAAVAAGWRPAGLGPRVLRTETAGIVAATLLLHRFGDLGRPD
jgi:16S rRNA (uracil1498-N3)-methyltransferase